MRFCFLVNARLWNPRYGTWVDWLKSYFQKYVDEHSKNLLKQALVQYDRTLLVADNRRCEPKKFGGKGARARFQKSYR